MLSDYQEKIIWPEHSSKPATQLVQFFCLVRHFHFLRSFSGRATWIQKLRAALQCPLLTSLPFPPTAPMALAVLTFGMLWERTMAPRFPQTRCITVEWTSSPLLSNSDTGTAHGSPSALICSTSNQPGATRCHAQLPWAVPLLLRLPGITWWPQQEPGVGPSAPLLTELHPVRHSLSGAATPTQRLLHFPCLSYWLQHCSLPETLFCLRTSHVTAVPLYPITLPPIPRLCFPAHSAGMWAELRWAPSTLPGAQLMGHSTASPTKVLGPQHKLQSLQSCMFYPSCVALNYWYYLVSLLLVLFGIIGTEYQ